MNANKLNVMHLTSCFYLGGAEKLLLNILKDENMFDKISYTLVVLKGVMDKDIENELRSLKNCKVYLYDDIFRKPETLLTLRKIIKENKIELIHSHGNGGEKWSVFCKLANPGLKLVRTVHDTNVVNNFSKFDLFTVRNLIDTNVAISKTVYSECIDNSVLNTELVYNGIKVDEFSKFIRKTRSESDELRIVNVARIMLPKKGQDILIKALRECKDRGIKFKCDFIGGIYEQFKDSYSYLQELVQQTRLDNEVRFLGPKYNVNELIQDYDVFVLPSRIEGFGIVVLEAMAAKIPIIASNIDGPKELISHGENGLLFENENHIDLADKITELYQNRKRMTELAQNAHRFVQDFDISRISNNLYDLYCNVLRGN